MSKDFETFLLTLLGVSLVLWRRERLITSIATPVLLPLAPKFSTSAFPIYSCFTFNNPEVCIPDFFPNFHILQHCMDIYHRESNPVWASTISTDYSKFDIAPKKPIVSGNNGSAWIFLDSYSQYKLCWIRPKNHFTLLSLTCTICSTIFWRTHTYSLYYTSFLGKNFYKYSA